MLLESSKQSPRLLASGDLSQASVYLNPWSTQGSPITAERTCHSQMGISISGPCHWGNETHGHNATFYQSCIWHEPSLGRLAFESIIGWASPLKARTLKPSKSETFWVLAIYSKWKLQIWSHVIDFNQNTGTKTVFTLGVCGRHRTSVSFMLRRGSGA